MQPRLRSIALFLGFSLAVIAAACEGDDDPWVLLPVGGSGGGGGSGGEEEIDRSCRAGKLLETLEKSRLLIGAQMDEEVAAAGEFDLRELDITGGVPDQEGPCEACDSSCTSVGNECQNEGGGCGWWGCWQWDELPPGAQIRDFVAGAQQAGQLPMITYNQFLLSSGSPTYEGGLLALGEAHIVSRYFNDWRFLLQQIGEERAVLQLEPVLFQVAQSRFPDAAEIPASVSEANPTDCGEEEDSFAGFGRCLIKMARLHAPNSIVGFRAAPEAIFEGDIFLNRDRSLELASVAVEVGDYLRACGADEADFVSISPATRDAGWAGLNLDEDWWWDASNTTLPNFHQVFTWGRVLAEELDLPILWWRIPVGHMKLLPGKSRAWPDNRLDYFFDHMDEVAASQAFAVTFGAGEWKQTTPATDGGNLLRRLEEHREAGGQLPCPEEP